MVGVPLVVLLVGAGAMVLTNFGSGASLLGGAEKDTAPSGTSDASKGSSESSESPGVKPDAPPDPAFEHLLPTLEGMTDASIMLPARLPDEMGLPAIYGYYSGEGYGIVFPYGPTETVPEVSNAQTLGSLRAYPEEEDVANEFFDAERIEEVVLPDGTEATLRYMVPAGRSGSQGPFWEGKFDKDGYTYNLTVIKPKEITEDQVRRALSTMVLVPDSGGASTTSEPSWMSDEEIASLEEFGRRYDEAVRGEDWEATYSMLDESSQQQFTEEEWAQKQQVLIDASGPPAPLERVTVEQDEEAADGPVTLRLSYEDGTAESMMAMIPMVVDDPGDSGEPQRILTEEEISKLEELPTSGSSTPSATNLEAEAEQAAGDYYRAAGVEDWKYTYDHLDSQTQSKFTKGEWFKKNQWLADNYPTIYYILSVNLRSTSPEPIAQVGVRLTGEDGSSSTRSTFFVYEDGSWKHRFAREEYALFMPDASYKEFIEAQ
jgi:hypothetical protein